MLAYLFWHWAERRVDRDGYEALLRAFHARLREASLDGFDDSTTFRVHALPWIAAGGDAYEDWYLLRGSFALDGLNEAAVSGERRGLHEEIVRQVSAGTGGLYRLRHGNASLHSGVAHWFSKPAGVSYAALDAQLEPLVAHSGAGLWQRQMALGLAPEFCLIADTTVPLGDLSPILAIHEAI
ncbi:MAG TPA: hypothetical protein VME66_04455 [Candidatus Acidoferrales bacterium]|nr:hypothetical protein [Candidatus Acidoferrales bacterium]